MRERGTQRIPGPQSADADLEYARIHHAERMAVGAAVKECGLVGGYDLRGSDFSHPAARRLWDAMLDFLERGKRWAGPEDLAIRVADSESERLALEDYLADPVVDVLSDPRDLPDAATTVREASITRRALDVCAQAEGLAARGHTGAELVAELQASLQQLRAEGGGRLESRSGGEIAERLLAAIEHPEADADGNGTYVPFGLPRLDRALGGWQGALVYVLAGRTSHGKSAAMLQFALHASSVLKGRRPVHILSAEDLIGDTGRRLLSWISDVPASDMRRPDAMSARDRERVLASRERISTLDRIRLTPVPGMTARQIVSLVRRYQDEDETRIVFFDYLQKLPKSRKRSGGDSEPQKENDLYTEAMDLFDLNAKETGMPWVIGSQVKRSDAEIPGIRDMRGSGAIEQCAKGVIIVNRPNFETKRPDNVITISASKWSNGEVCDINCRWDGPRMRIIDERPGMAPMTLPRGKDFRGRK